MKYSEAVDYLDSRVSLGVKPSLERISRVLNMLGNPQRGFDSIQITGTNGKTSVSHMISRILQEAGFNVGLFTSPHLETVRERIVVNGQVISVDSFTRVMEKIIPFIEEAEKELCEELTYFEVVTALCFDYFREVGIDVGVLEVGMGGRWDATNVVDSKVCVITNIGMDHVKELGPTKAHIAREKAGIISPNSVVVTAEATREILEIFSQECLRRDARLCVFGREFKLDYVLPYRVRGEAPAQLISIIGLNNKRYSDIKIPLLGKHQTVNAACAVFASQCFIESTTLERTLDVETVRSALGSVRIPGRLEVVRERPLLVLDGAHNPDGVSKLVSSLVSEFEYKKLIFVVSILDDKDARKILDTLGSAGDLIVCTQNRSTRAIPAAELARMCETLGIRYELKEDFAEAMNYALDIAQPLGLVCVTGSLYTVSEARIFLRQQSVSLEMRQDR